MFRTTFIALCVAAAVSGCASPPEVVVPSPYGRQPINTAEAIDKYREQSAEETRLQHERTSLEREVAALQSQVAQLKAYVLMQNVIANDSSTAPPKPVAAPQPTPNVPPQTEKPAKTSPIKINETSSIEIHGDTVVFRVNHPLGMVDFEPDEKTKNKLLKAAHASNQIIIRGRTDSNYVNDANQRIALGRAVEARKFLVSNGIDDDKIRLFFLSAGDHIADNNTDAGKALNRRVELEAHGIDAKHLFGGDFTGS